MEINKLRSELVLPLTQGSAGGQGRGPGVGDVDVLVAGGGPALPARGALCQWSLVSLELTTKLPPGTLRESLLTAQVITWSSENHSPWSLARSLKLRRPVNHSLWIVAPSKWGP